MVSPVSVDDRVELADGGDPIVAAKLVGLGSVVNNGHYILGSQQFVIHYSDLDLRVLYREAFDDEGSGEGII